MKQWKRLAGRLLHPGKSLSVLIIVTGFGLLIGLPCCGITDTAANYFSYTLSFYALVLIIVHGIPLVRKAAGLYSKARAAGIFHISRSLMASLFINVVYGGYHLVSGILYESAWLFSNGVYYLVLSLIRLVLVRYEKKQSFLADPSENRKLGWKGFCACGRMMFLLNIAMSGMVVQMIRDGRGSTYPEILVYAVACYTFYRLTTAIIRVVRNGKDGNPIHGAARNISLTAAIMSLYSLQITMLNVFGDGSGNDRLLNSMSGAAVCVLVVFGALGMVIHGTKRAKEIGV